MSEKKNNDGKVVTGHEPSGRPITHTLIPMSEPGTPGSQIPPSTDGSYWTRGVYHNDRGPQFAPPYELVSDGKGGEVLVDKSTSPTES